MSQHGRIEKRATGRGKKFNKQGRDFNYQLGLK